MSEKCYIYEPIIFVYAVMNFYIKIMNFRSISYVLVFHSRRLNASYFQALVMLKYETILLFSKLSKLHRTYIVNIIKIQVGSKEL